MFSVGRGGREEKIKSFKFSHIYVSVMQYVMLERLLYSFPPGILIYTTFWHHIFF